MTGDVQVYLDDTPGEQRGILVRDGRIERLIIQSEDAVAEHRLGAVLVGRIREIQSGLKAAFVDLGVDGPDGFLPFRKGLTLNTGDRIEVEVVAEPREAKGPVLRWRGAAEGPPRQVSPGPDVRSVLTQLAPGVPVVTGLEAIRIGLEAEEEALSGRFVDLTNGIDVRVERTRGLIAVDIDHTPLARRDIRKSRASANRLGIAEAARLMRLNQWGGLVVIDLVGVHGDMDGMREAATKAFSGDGAVVVGPVSRFGVLELSVPWGRQPLDEVLRDRPMCRAIRLVRQLNHDLLADTTVARLVARCPVDIAQMAALLVERLGPRAALIADLALSGRQMRIEEA